MIHLNEFSDPSEIIEWGAADTEARLFVDGEIPTSEELVEMGKDETNHPQKWWREHTRVEVWAWLFSDGKRLFWCDDFVEFVDFCAAHKISAVWWYNAKYDFAHIDYYLLTNGWKMRDGKRRSGNMYESLHSQTGARYSYKIWREYRAKDRHKYTHVTTHYDLCNIFGGGLAKCINAFSVAYLDGTPIYKKEMDYQKGESDSRAAEYIRADADGLFYLVKAASDYLLNHFGISLAGRRPDAITAAGVAKRVLLNELYPQGETHSERVRIYQRLHRMDANLDAYARNHFLYRGGLCFVNRKYQNLLIDKPIHKYDFNSHYPAQMSKMSDFIGRPFAVSLEKYESMTAKERAKHIAIYEISYLRGSVLPDMLPVWYDPITRDYTATPEIEPSAVPQWYFKEEFEELSKWYSVDFEISRVILLKKTRCNGWKNYVNRVYKDKADGKREKNGVKVAVSKLLLNSAYGKLAENPKRAKSHRELNEAGVVRLVDDGDEIDERSIMNVFQGAIITSMARVGLLRAIRETCPNPSQDFIYCDTDSIHAFTEYPNPDAYALGELKDEGTYTAGKYLAPKTYFVATKNGGEWEYEIHSKGVPTKAILQEMRDGITPDEFSETLFRDGKKFLCLAGMNIKGGKALIPIPKFLCRTDNTISRNDAGEHELLMQGE